MKKKIKVKPVSDSRKSYLAREAAMSRGVCIWCRVNEPHPGRTRCLPCIVKDRIRKRPGSAYKPGGRGRPPLF